MESQQRGVDLAYSYQQTMLQIPCCNYCGMLCTKLLPACCKRSARASCCPAAAHLMEVICFTTSAGECRSMRRLWILYKHNNTASGGDSR